MTRIVLTGATTMIGAEVLKELLKWSEVTSLQLLLPDRAAAERLQSFAGPWPAHVRVADDDIDDCDVVIHCAQRETLDDNLVAAREANVRSLAYWVAQLERRPSMRLHHLSTAFVAGTRRGLFTEFDLDVGQSFHNAYEQSKFEAEVRLRASAVSDRITIHRPSHVAGRMPLFVPGGAHALLAALASLSVLPGDPRARVDFIPADYVAAAIVALVRRNASGTFHLACGWEGSLPVKRAAALSANGRGAAVLLPRLIPWPRGAAGASLYQGAVFDTFLADGALAMSKPSAESWIAEAARLSTEPRARLRVASA
jgi:nucleoside-diphosphate-sugar epimerase